MRMQHTMLRANDLERSLAPSTGPLGMRLLRRHDFPGGRSTLAFVGYGDESEHTVLELTHAWDTDHCGLGPGFGHVTLGVEDIYATCDRLRAARVKVVREPGPAQHGSTVIAFLDDPNGDRNALIEGKGR